MARKKSLVSETPHLIEVFTTLIYEPSKRAKLGMLGKITKISGPKNCPFF